MWTIHVGLHPDSTNVATLQSYSETFTLLSDYCKLKIDAEHLFKNGDVDGAMDIEIQLENISNKIPIGARWW